LLLLVAVIKLPANAEQASLQDRLGMSASVADYIHDHDYGKSNPFQTDAVEIGAAAIEAHHSAEEYTRYALADWRSADGKGHGQVLFSYLCDHWNIEAVSIGRPFSAQRLVEEAKRLPAATASKLVAQVVQLEKLNIAYLKPAHPGISC
jgi:hypothetical protein